MHNNRECPFCNSLYIVPNGDTSQGRSVSHCMICGGDFETVSGDPVWTEVDDDWPEPTRDDDEHERPDEGLHPHQGEWF